MRCHPCCLHCLDGLLIFLAVNSLLIQPPLASGCQCADNCTVPFPQLHVVDAILSNNITFFYNYSHNIGFNPRWCIDGRYAENPALWRNLSFSFKDNNQETTFTYNNPSPSDKVNGLIVYLINHAEGECHNVQGAVPIKIETSNTTGRWFLLYIIEGDKDTQCTDLPSTSTITTVAPRTSSTPQSSLTLTTPQSSTTQLLPTSTYRHRGTTTSELRSSESRPPTINPTFTMKTIINTQGESILCQVTPTAAATTATVYTMSMPDVQNPGQAIQPYSISLSVLVPLLIALLIGTNLVWIVTVVLLCLKRPSTPKSKKGTETGTTFVSVLAKETEAEELEQN